jgi:AraC family transcriptional regulator
MTQKKNAMSRNLIERVDIIFVPAGQSNSCYQSKDGICSPLHICLKPELIAQVTEASEIDPARVDLVNCFG